MKWDGKFPYNRLKMSRSEMRYVRYQVTTLNGKTNWRQRRIVQVFAKIENCSKGFTGFSLSY